MQLLLFSYCFVLARAAAVIPRASLGPFPKVYSASSTPESCIQSMGTVCGGQALENVTSRQHLVLINSDSSESTYSLNYQGMNDSCKAHDADMLRTQYNGSVYGNVFQVATACSSDGLQDTIQDSTASGFNVNITRANFDTWVDLDPSGPCPARPQYRRLSGGFGDNKTCTAGSSSTS